MKNHADILERLLHSSNVDAETREREVDKFVQRFNESHSSDQGESYTNNEDEDELLEFPILNSTAKKYNRSPFFHVWQTPKKTVMNPARYKSEHDRMLSEAKLQYDLKTKPHREIESSRISANSLEASLFVVEDFTMEEVREFKKNHATHLRSAAEMRNLAGRYRQLYNLCNRQTSASYSIKNQNRSNMKSKALEYEKSFKIANFIASNLYFHQHNNHILNSARNLEDEGEVLLDLHGQQRQEAESILENYVRNKNQYSRSRRSPLLVITGRGSHSVRGISVLKPIVIAFCDKRGLKYKLHRDYGIKIYI